MRAVFVVLFTCLQVFAFELVLNTGRQNNQAFAVLHLNNDLEFTCKKLFKETKPYFECNILGAVDKKLKDQNFSAFDLNFIQEAQEIKMMIFPKMDAKVFDSSQNIYIDTKLTPSNSHKSKAFTFIFMPGLKQNKVYDGLDFNIHFPHESLPYIGALDLNSDPVLIPQSADINTYLRIKKEYEQANYNQVEIDAQNAIKRYEGSIFANEFMLYKLRAQNKLYTQDPSMRDHQILEKMIDDAKNWTRTFTSDRNFSEVLYLMLRTYIALAQSTDVKYIMSILDNDQPNSYFAQLSKLDYADYIYNLNEKDEAVSIYENIYFNTKNLDLAARAAMSLAKNLLLNKEVDKALEYINTVLKANEEYFGKDPLRSLELAKLLSQEGQFDLSARIYEYAFVKMSKLDPNYEELLKDLALSLSHTTKVNEAKKYLDLYMNDYLDGKYVEEIKKANDELFLTLMDNNASSLHERYKDLMKEYANKDENIVNKALDADIALYYKEGNFSAVLAYKDLVESKKLSSATQFLQKAALNDLKNAIKANDCLGATNIFMRFKAYDIDQNLENKKQMLACFIRTSKIQEALNYIDKNYSEDPIFYGLEKAFILFNNKQYTQVLNLARQIADSRTLKSEDENFKAYYLQFLSLLRLNEYNKAIKILQILESFPMNFSMVELYDALLSYANDHNMQTTILTYAPKAINYQNFKGINLFSPNLEFIYLDALAKINKNEESLAVLTDLLKLKLLDEDRARALYIKALTYERMQNIKAQKESLKECIEIKNPSNWQDLCKSKNQILAQE